MKEGQGIMKWLAIVIIVIIIAIILLLVIFLPILIETTRADIDINDFIIDLQIGNQNAILNLPAKLTEFKQERELAQVSLLGAPFILSGQTMVAVRDLGRIFPAKVEWCSINRNIMVEIPAGIISMSKLVFTIIEKEYVIKNDRAFISLRALSKLLRVSEIIWSPESKGIRLIWYNQ